MHHENKLRNKFIEACEMVLEFCRQDLLRRFDKLKTQEEKEDFTDYIIAESIKSEAFIFHAYVMARHKAQIDEWNQKEVENAN